MFEFKDDRLTNYIKNPEANELFSILKQKLIQGKSDGPASEEEIRSLARFALGFTYLDNLIQDIIVNDKLIIALDEYGTPQITEVGKNLSLANEVSYYVEELFKYGDKKQ